MPFARCMLIIFVIALLPGCSEEKVRQGLYQGLYEGNRMQEQREMSPQERINKQDMDYRQYSNERKERME
ncbi:MAG TPA: hypothetical protein VMJ66_06135 [Geobacteraceae bacterium]|nr:hypothetical protein [Geobacteraceae bacterium]